MYVTYFDARRIFEEIFFYICTFLSATVRFSTWLSCQPV